MMMAVEEFVNLFPVILLKNVTRESVVSQTVPLKTVGMMVVEEGVQTTVQS